MLYSRKSVVPGISFRPASLPSSGEIALPLCNGRIHYPTVTFEATAQIQIPDTIGGSYGDEFRPD